MRIVHFEVSPFCFYFEVGRLWHLGPRRACCIISGWYTKEWGIGVMITSGGKPKNSKKNLPQCSLTTTNPKWTALELNSSFWAEQPATKHVSYGTAFPPFQHLKPSVLNIINMAGVGTSKMKTDLENMYVAPLISVWLDIIKICLTLTNMSLGKNKNSHMASFFFWSLDCNWFPS
jgi:hypothetical protein